MLMEPKNLKPCPFCGGEASYKIPDPQNGYDVGWIGCKKCRCFMNFYNNTRGINEATEAWNRRAENV